MPVYQTSSFRYDVKLIKSIQDLINLRIWCLFIKNDIDNIFISNITNKNLFWSSIREAPIILTEEQYIEKLQHFCNMGNLVVGMQNTWGTKSDRSLYKWICEISEFDTKGILLRYSGLIIFE